jgi:hypothetical protein
MLCALALLVATFPDAPLADQVALGRSLATKEPLLRLSDLFRSPEPRSSISRIWGEDRQTIGLWSNGYVKVPVEHVVWISPSLVSRWLGFLSAREYWQEEELQTRWTSVAKVVGERRFFIVQLSAYPKIPTYEIGDYERTTPEEIENVRFVYTSGGGSQRMEAVRIAQWQSRRRVDLEDFPWWQHTELGSALTGEFELASDEAPLPIGDYYRAWYAVWVTGAKDEAFEVRALSRRKERVAKFGAKR